MDDLRQKYIDAISGAADEATLEDIRVQAVGKKGEVALKMRELGKMTPEERQLVGPKLNALKDEINSALAAKKMALGDAALDERLKTEWLDVTLPGRARRQGTIHPVSQVTEEVTTIFADMGFSVAEGPTIRPAPRWTRSTCPPPRATTARRMCCAPIPARCRSGRWKSWARRSG
jgi:phenylalanyl-tRNA synthetase alpha chain